MKTIIFIIALLSMAPVMAGNSDGGAGLFKPTSWDGKANSTDSFSNWGNNPNDIWRDRQDPPTRVDEDTLKWFVAKADERRNLAKVIEVPAATAALIKQIQETQNESPVVVAEETFAFVTSPVAAMKNLAVTESNEQSLSLVTGSTEELKARMVALEMAMAKEPLLPFEGNDPNQYFFVPKSMKKDIMENMASQKVRWVSINAVSSEVVFESMDLMNQAHRYQAPVHFMESYFPKKISDAIDTSANMQGEWMQVLEANEF